MGSPGIFERLFRHAGVCLLQTSSSTARFMGPRCGTPPSAATSRVISINAQLGCRARGLFREHWGIRWAMAETRTTTDHDEIRRWVEQHDGSPAVVRGTGSKNSLGVLRFDFPGGAGEDKLEHIDWEEWFDAFDSNNLALLYQEQKSSGEDSTFSKLVRRDQP
jgi:hypothetical protein